MPRKASETRRFCGRGAPGGRGRRSRAQNWLGLHWLYCPACARSSVRATGAGGAGFGCV